MESMLHLIGALETCPFMQGASGIDGFCKWRVANMPEFAC
jgi:hypothetical protein